MSFCTSKASKDAHLFRAPDEQQLRVSLRHSACKYLYYFTSKAGSAAAAGRPAPLSLSVFVLCTSKASKVRTLMKEARVAVSLRSAAPRGPSAATSTCSIRQHTSAYVSVCQRTSSYGLELRREHLDLAPWLDFVLVACVADVPHELLHTSAYVSIRQHTSAYVSCVLVACVADVAPELLHLLRQYLYSSTRKANKAAVQQAKQQ